MGKKSSSKKEIKQSKSARFRTQAGKIIKKRSKKENSDITYQRRHSYYTDPARGGKGLCVKASRMMRVMRSARASFPEEFRVLLTHSKSTKNKQQFSQSFSTVAVGGMDALANRVMEVASIICKARTGVKDENKGLPLRKSDMAAAIKLVKQMAH